MFAKLIRYVKDERMRTGTQVTGAGKTKTGAGMGTIHDAKTNNQPQPLFDQEKTPQQTDRSLEPSRVSRGITSWDL